MNTNKLLKLKNLHECATDKQWVAMTKHRILAEISRRQEMRQSVVLTPRERARLFMLRVSRRFVPSQVKVVAALLIITVMASTGVMAQAAVPGDILWPVKITMEKAEVALAMDTAQEGRVHIRHVDNRLKELSIIVAQPDTQAKANNISQLVRRLEKDITAAGQSLKMTKEEKQDTQPQVIIALAKDLTDKANQAVKVLEENKKTLAVEEGVPVTEPIGGVAASTSTQQIVDGEGSQNDTATNAPRAIAAVPQTPKQKTEADVQQTITEVQIVNEYISYAALETMIDMIEHQGGTNRYEVTALLKQKIDDQSTRLTALEEAVPLITDNFLLHKSQARVISKNAEKEIDEATAFMSLDNLSASLNKLVVAKDTISQLANVLQEVSRAHGLRIKQDSATGTKPKDTSGQILIQSMPVTTSTGPETN